MNIWAKCKGINSITSLSETAWRIVEAQEVTSTRKLVDSLEEQIILEDLIESSKPPIIKPLLDMHPLLYTPFRYPPLKHGSRFSKSSEASLWYGSVALTTAMAEMAFYRFNFLRASKAQYDNVEISLTAFSAQIKTPRGIKLPLPPFAQYSPMISSPISYEVSQTLGTAMRQADVEAFSYQSARHPNPAINIALFTAKAFLHKNPNKQSFQSWQCIANDRLIEFIRSSVMTPESVSFPIDMFLINSELPFPAI
ncbi:RES family NAD+ phosphorylase [soil metagenome]